MSAARNLPDSVPRSYADGWPGPWFDFGPKLGGVEYIKDSLGRPLGLYLPGDNICFLPNERGAVATRWTCGEWGARARMHWPGNVESCERDAGW